MDADGFNGNGVLIGKHIIELTALLDFPIFQLALGAGRGKHTLHRPS
jgi:hypothetical protein